MREHQIKLQSISNIIQSCLSQTNSPESLLRAKAQISGLLSRVKSEPEQRQFTSVLFQTTSLSSTLQRALSCFALTEYSRIFSNTQEISYYALQRVQDSDLLDDPLFWSELSVLYKVLGVKLPQIDVQNTIRELISMLNHKNRQIVILSGNELLRSKKESDLRSIFGSEILKGEFADCNQLLEGVEVLNGADSNSFTQKELNTIQELVVKSQQGPKRLKQEGTKLLTRFAHKLDLDSLLMDFQNFKDSEFIKQLKQLIQKHSTKSEIEQVYDIAQNNIEQNENIEQKTEPEKSQDVKALYDSQAINKMDIIEALNDPINENEAQSESEKSKTDIPEPEETYSNESYSQEHLSQSFNQAVEEEYSEPEPAELTEDYEDLVHDVDYYEEIHVKDLDKWLKVNKPFSLTNNKLKHIQEVSQKAPSGFTIPFLKNKLMDLKQFLSTLMPGQVQITEILTQFNQNEPDFEEIRDYHRPAAWCVTQLLEHGFIDQALNWVQKGFQQQVFNECEELEIIQLLKKGENGQRWHEIAALLAEME
ncbi:Hypothetical_protein [Hexamita inflata]|uniref:Hypothetical_protein n=1 Tax=Hexamita inflata TaxID=28002 RepID=A0AA86QYW6_9EUKA|nr:Hypothetical protein HINF_LOCUS56299 [Hexamita inflata]